MLLKDIKKYVRIFNVQTLLVTGISILSCYLSLRFELRIFTDFLIIGIIIVFPLTFTMREAFRRREHSIQYLSLLKASLQSTLYLFEITKLDQGKKVELRRISDNIIDSLLKYLSKETQDASAVQGASMELGVFIKQHKKAVKNNSFKVFSFVLRMNECIEFLLAVRRHHTPWGPKVIALISIYAFAIFYPASVMFSASTNIEVWNLLIMTVMKILILISLYNIQVLMEDPFNVNTPDGIRLDDFRLSSENTYEVSGNLILPDSPISNSIKDDKIYHN